MAYKAKDFARSTLAGGINAAATSFTVLVGHGDRFPVLVSPDYTVIVLKDGAGNFEKVKAETRASGADTISTVTRGYDGTTARTWATGTIVECCPDATLVAQAINDRAQHEAAVDPHVQYLLQSEGDARYSQPAAAEALQNKTIGNTNTIAVKDANFTIQDDGDATKQAKFQLAGNTTGITRTYTPPDADANLAATNVKQTYTAQQTPKNGALTDGANIDWNGDSNGQVVAVTLGGNRTMNAPTNIQQYALYTIRIAQDATGSRTLGWNAAFKFGSTGAPTLTTTASKVDIISFIGGAGNTLECIGTRLNAV